MRIIGCGFCVLTFLVGCGPARAEEIGWQEAVGRLIGERTRAETCARLLKRYGDPAAVRQGGLTYGEAKSDIDAVIAGLIVALAKEEEPATLPDLETRLERGVKGREALCEQVQPLVPDTTGEKNVIVDLMAGPLGMLIDAAQTIYLEARVEDRLTRATIQSQLEATSWSAFASITP